MTRPDLCVTLGDLARITDPTPGQERLLRRAGDYVVTTGDLRLHFKPNQNCKGRELDPYVDASFDTCPDTSRSRSGMLVEFAGCPIVFNAKWQSFVALSSAEAE